MTDDTNPISPLSPPPSNKGKSVAESAKRPIVDDLLLKGMPPRRIVMYMREMHGEILAEKSVIDYRDNYFRSEHGIVAQIIKASQDLSDTEPPPTSDREMLAGFFTLKKTREDLDLIYDRIRKMKDLAERYPFDDSYDARIVDYLAKAESIRSRVFRHQYEMIRKAVILNIGKKIVTAAINVFLPYITGEKRKESVQRFEDIIKPMLGLAPEKEEPSDIQDIRADTDSSNPEKSDGVPGGSDVQEPQDIDIDEGSSGA